MEQRETHKNIYEALSAFQNELRAIDRNGEVEFERKDGKGKITFKYATLDNIMDTINPLLGKHGLSVRWELDHTRGENGITCYIHHESTSDKFIEVVKETRSVDGTVVIEKTKKKDITNTISSGKFPIDLTTGDMKTRGANITYGRRYTLGVALGVVSDQDLDAKLSEKAVESTVKFAYRTVLEGIEKAESQEELTKKIDFLKKEKEILKEGKYPPSLKFTEEQFDELITLAEKKLSALTIE